MLLEFRVANFRSIAAEQVVSLVASSDPAHSRSVVEDETVIGRPNLRLLRSVMLYGANASGKSNLCQALFTMKRLVEGSATELNEGDEMPDIVPFLLDAARESQPSVFEVTVTIRGDIYRYGFEATSSQILREWLYLTRKEPKSREVVLFNRVGADKSGWHFGASFGGNSKHLVARTRASNCLLLSKAAQESYEQLTLVYEWFRDGLRVVNMAAPPDQLLTGTAIQCQLGWPTLSGLFAAAQVADDGIASVGTRTRSVPISEEVTQRIRKLSKQVPIPHELEIPELRILRSQHDSRELVEFELSDESNGTRRFLAIAGLLLEAFQKGQTLVLDELECSLHPLLTRQIAETVNDRGLGSRGAQFIIATHDSNLFDFELLRRDQIYLVEKGRDNQTDVFSLYDLEPKPKGDAAAERQYLSRRFGGVPALGSLRAAIAMSIHQWNEVESKEKASVA